jgi:hypothetical protein
MAVHTLKIDPDLFVDVCTEKKTAEVRKDDRNFMVGDTLVIYPFDRKSVAITGANFVHRVVTHKVQGGQYGIEDGYCLLSMKPMSITEEQRAKSLGWLAMIKPKINSNKVGGFSDGRA